MLGLVGGEAAVAGRGRRSHVRHVRGLLMGHFGHLCMGHAGHLLVGNTHKLFLGHAGHLLVGHTGQLCLGHPSQLFFGHAGQLFLGHAGQLPGGQIVLQRFHVRKHQRGHVRDGGAGRGEVCGGQGWKGRKSISKTKQ
ncbi:hypothetical protein E2C01_004361 [Portunus trituberculatus]|uniref:Uncharacterized protein n=1 Tax=Portunus trituberculatus TaxID=210409 RepID=A0A5B7CQH6_PORTR|nr:hypothetical protein [Portunus trituberculatus]